LNVLVDTSVWSAVLRRKSHNADAYRHLMELVRQKRARMIGPVRQELLSGLREMPHYERLRDYLRAFPDEALTTEDYEQAALFFNACRAAGIQGSNTDFLICAVANRLQLLIYTFDQDFRQYSLHIPVRLFLTP
jgi:predicted nucleic acid-binding protein